MNAARKAVSATLVLACAAVGCTNNPETREYAVPDSLCGVDIDPDLFDPLFPPGDELELLDSAGEETSDTDAPAHSCGVSVDGERVFTVFSSPFPPELGLEGYFDDINYDAVFADGETVAAGPFEARVWNFLAVAYSPCETRSGLNGLGVSIVMEDEDADQRETLGDVIGPFAEARAAQVELAPCETG